jgi:hypothetical protein
MSFFCMAITFSFPVVSVKWACARRHSNHSLNEIHASTSNDFLSLPRIPFPEPFLLFLCVIAQAPKWGN